MNLVSKSAGVFLTILKITNFNGLAGVPEASFNGTFSASDNLRNWKATSQNLLFSCRYEVEAVSDEQRRLKDFQFYEHGELLFSFHRNIPGDDLYISNTGYIAFIDLNQHFDARTIIHFYNKHGKPLFSSSFSGGSSFQFSSSGNAFGLAADNQIVIITLPEGVIQTFPNGYQFAFSEDDRQIAIADKELIRIYRDDQKHTIHSGIQIPRKLVISKRLAIIAIIDKRNLKMYSLSTGELIFHDKSNGNISFRDLLIEDDFLYAGLHDKSTGQSRGILWKYDRSGRKLLEKMDEIRTIPSIVDPPSEPRNCLPNDSLPWPFVPFDSMPEIWNHYEQHMGGSGPNDSYLHQGLDIITPIGEPTYAVKAGIVKCVLTIGGDSYWRLAISDQQSSGYTDGWLYAHLIENSIQVEVGDTVQLHEYLGDIIEWSGNWGHIHFVQIRDSGLVWQYNDGEWGINFNPQLVLKANPDTIPPVIENVFPDSKFAFCINETSQYLEPDSLYGEVDIIVKVNDRCGFSAWTQPAFSLYYQIKSLPAGNVVFPRTLAQILNHSYPFYSSTNFKPYATLLYKRDDILLPSSWMNINRNYYHILTNNNGDSLAELSEKSLALITTNFPDGWYRLIVEAYDEYGNLAMDSLDVRFVNSISSLAAQSALPAQIKLKQNYPNPFNPSTSISWQLAVGSEVELIIFTSVGQRVRTLVKEKKPAGYYSVIWDGRDDDGNILASGIYLYRIRAGEFVSIQKMVLMR